MTDSSHTTNLYPTFNPPIEAADHGRESHGQEITSPASWISRSRIALRSVRAGLEQREEQVFLALAFVIGALTGLTVVAFIVLTEHLGMRLYPPGSAAWRRVSFPFAGSLLIGYLLYHYFPYARGSGVPQTKSALYARGGRITLRTVLGKFLCTSATLASGIPLGREGPSVQVGSGIASVLGRNLGLSQERVKALIPVGASAAIAAAFNTPMAAVVFALEEIVGDLNAPVLGSVVIASVASWGVLRALLGTNPLFSVPQYELVHPVEFVAYAVLGVAGGLVSALFTKLLLGMRVRFMRLPRRTAPFQPVVGGLVVGLLGWMVPQVLGVGYGYVGNALNGKMAVELMLVLVFLKLISVTTSYASGNAGGIFGPALFIGAMLGGSLGTIAHHWFPRHTANSGAYALVGMGAAFAGIVRAPMTSVIMIFEMTRDYAVIVPLMISNMISLFICSRLEPTPTYESLAIQDGIHLPSAEARSRLAQRQIARVMRPSSGLVSAALTIREALASFSRSGLRTCIIIDDRGVIGVINRETLEQEFSREPDEGISKLAQVLNFPHVHADQSLDEALDRMGANHIDILPVVSRANVHKLEGTVSLGDVLNSYGITPQV
ncbi:MAG: chloride channel protein [Acidobacteria bacterium]|nr:chloride channel protein [Acidobacteriota bacterium]